MTEITRGTTQVLHNLSLLYKQFLKFTGAVDMSPATLAPIPATKLLDCAPVVVNEAQVVAFTFYQAQEVVKGMRYQHELYKLVSEVDAQRQLEAYNLAYAVAGQGGSVVVTVSKQRYQVWVSLRSPALVSSASMTDRTELMAA